MTVKKRKDAKTWGYDFYDVYKRRHQKQGFKTKSEAQRAEAKAMETADKGIKLTNTEAKFTDLAASFIELYAKVYLKKSTINNYENQLKYYILPYFNEIKVRDITPEIISKFISQHKQSELKNRSINHAILTIKRVLNYGVDNGIIFYNPASKIKKLSEEITEQRFLNEEQIKTILATAKENFPNFYPLIYTATYTGCRQGELLALTWDCIDLANKKLLIKENLYRGTIGTPKTKTSARTIDISQGLVDVLTEWRDKCPKSHYRLVFPNKLGNYQDSKNMINRYFNYCLNFAEIPKIRWHDLRHTYVSLLIAKEVDYKYIQQQIGHASIKITLDTYGHLMPSIYQKCKSIINEL
ncbi:MAG: tyrosine-type recombinase/integrase [bacterium]